MSAIDEYLAQVRASAPQGTYGVLTNYSPTWKPVQYGESFGYVTVDPSTGQSVGQDASGRWRFQVPGGTDDNGTPTMAWGNYADYGNIPTEFNAAGNMYRTATTDPSRFWGGAGAPHAYDYYQYNDPTNDLVANGTWNLVSPGEHYEGETYFWNGVNNASYTDALRKSLQGTLSPLEQARLAAPEAVGQTAMRGDLVGLNPLGQSGAELAFYDPNLLNSVGLTLTPEQQAARATQIANSTPQAQDDGDGGFGDFLPVLVLAGIGIATGGFGLMGAAAETAAMTGIEAGVMTAAEAAAAETAAMSAWAAAPASGMMESVLTNAAIGAGTSAIRGGDPLVGAITGGIGGAISASGALSDVSGGLISSTGAEGAAATAITKGVNAAATGAIGATLNGGSFSDVLTSGMTSGLTSAAGNYVSGELRADGASGTVAGGAGGATAGLTNAILTGGDLASGLITSGAAGAAAGAASDAGAGPVTAGAVGALTGGLVGDALAPEPVTPTPTGTTAGTTTSTTQTAGGDLSWGDLTFNYATKPRADMAWGTRLAGG